MPASRMPKLEIVPLPISPLTLKCPFCSAGPGSDCATTTGGFAVVHVERVKKAATADRLNASRAAAAKKANASRTAKKKRAR